MKYVVLKKGQIFVPGGTRKAYYRYDPRTKKQPWEMTLEEFMTTDPQWQSEQRNISFEQWAKQKGIEIPNVDMGKVFGMTMIPNKTAREKGKWKSELSKYAKYQDILNQYHKEVPLSKESNKASEIQAKVLHKRKVRTALHEGKQVPKEILDSYPDLK